MENAGRLGDERRQPTGVEVAPARTGDPGIAVVDIDPDRGIPVPVVRRVDGELRLPLGDDHSRVGADEEPFAAVEGEKGGAIAERERQGGLRAVDHHARVQQPAPGLQHHRVRGEPGHRQDAEDGADRKVGRGIGRAVERVDDHGERRRQIKDLGGRVLLGACHGDRGRAQRRGEEPVGLDVERGLGVAIGIAADHLGEAGAQRAEGDLLGQCHGRFGDGPDDGGDLATWRAGTGACRPLVQLIRQRHAHAIASPRSSGCDVSGTGSTPEWTDDLEL